VLDTPIVDRDDLYEAMPLAYRWSIRFPGRDDLDAVIISGYTHYRHAVSASRHSELRETEITYF
jgi:hypothetical protein